MGKNRKNINSALAGAKSRIAAGLIVRGLALSGTFLITYFFAFWFLDSLLLFGYGQRYILNVAFFCALAAAVYLLLIRRLIRQVSDGAAALALQRAHPKLKDNIINSVQFAELLKQEASSGMSLELAEEYIRRTDRLLEGGGFLPDSPFKENGKALALFLALFLIFCFAVLPQGGSRAALMRLFFPLEEISYPGGAGKKVLAPELGEVRVKVFYPSYTKFKPTEISEGGNAVILKGSTALISGVSSLPLRAAVLKYKGRQERSLAMSVRARLYPEVKLRITEDFNFKLEAFGKNGLASLGKEWHSIRTIDDEFPRVNLIFPAQDLLVAPKAELKLVYEYGDDFGVSEAALVFVKGGKNFRVPLEHNSPAVQRRVSEYLWNVTALSLSFGETIEYWIEAADNDTETGPKRSLSKKQKLSVPPLAEYMALTKKYDPEKEKELLDGTNNLYSRNEDLLKSLEKYKRNGSYDLAKLRGDLDLLFKQMLAMQRNLLDMAQVLPSGAMPQGKASDLGLSEMGQLMQQLQEALNKGDYDAAEKLAKELSAKINELIKKMASAMKNGRNGKKAAGMDAGREAKEMLKEEQGIYEETADAEKKSTAEFLKSQDALYKKALELQTKAAEKSAALLQGIALNRNPQPALIPQAGEVQAGANNGKFLLEGKKFKEAKELIAGAASGSNKMSVVFSGSAGKLQAEIGRAAAAAAAAERAGDKAGAEKLKSGLAGLEAGFKEAGETAAGYFGIESIEKEVLSLLSGKTKMTPEELARMGGTKERQGKNRSRMKSLNDKLGEAQKGGVKLDALTDKADEALKGMGEAEDNLGGGTLKGAIAGEQEALDSLQKLSDEADKMAEEGGEGGISVVMPGQGQSGVLGTREGKVSVPQEKDYKPPKEFRQDIMDSLKEKLPEKDKDDIEEYYKRLLR